jgi:hypothetical protein
VAAVSAPTGVDAIDEQTIVTDDEICERLRDLLRRAGYSALDHVGRRPLKRWISEFTIWAVAVAFAISIAGALMNRVGLPSWLSFVLAGALVATLIMPAVEEGGRLELFVACVYLALPVGAFLWAVFAGAGVVETLAWHVAPIVAVVVVILTLHRFERAWLRRTLGALANALSTVPIVFALIGLVVFALVLTTEAWAVAQGENALRLGILAALIIVPEFLVLGHAVVGKIGARFDTTAAAIGATDETVGDALAQVARVGSDKDRQWFSENAEDRLRRAYADSAPATLASSFSKELRRPLRRQVTIRLMITVIAVGVVAATTIYLLAAVAIDPAVATEWADTSRIPQEKALVVAIPLGPYVKVAALLAIVATSIFLGFAITSDTLPDDLATAFIHESALTVLLLGVPCYALAVEPDVDEPVSRPPGV